MQARERPPEPDTGCNLPDPEQGSVNRAEEQKAENGRSRIDRDDEGEEDV